MPWLVAGIIQGVMWLFKNRIGFFLLQMAAWVGISWGTQTIVLQPTLDAIQSYASGVGSGAYGAMALHWLRFLNFDKAMTMVMGAYASKYAVTAGRMFIHKATA